MRIPPPFPQRTATSSVGRYVHRCSAARDKCCRYAVRTCTWLTGRWHPGVIPQDAPVQSWPTVPPSQVPLGHGWDHIRRSPSWHQCRDKVQRQPTPPPFNNLQQFAPLVAPQHVTVCPEPSFRNAVAKPVQLITLAVAQCRHMSAYAQRETLRRPCMQQQRKAAGENGRQE